MIDYLKPVILIVLSSVTPVLTSTNTLLYPIKKYQKIILFLFEFFLFYFLGEKFGQGITPIGISGMMLLIAFFHRKKAVINVCSGLLGYFCAVVLNYCFTIGLSFFGLTISMIASDYAIPFNATFSLCAFTVTYFIGKIVRKKWQNNDINLAPSILYLFFTEMCACVAIFIFNIICGERLGYTTKVIKMNGVLFFLFFIITSCITFFIISSYEKEKRVTAKLKEFENLQEYTGKIENLYMELRIFKHDYFNILSSIRAYIDSDNMSALKQFFEESILPAGEELNHKDTILGKLSYLEIEEIKGLIYTKLFHAMQHDMNIELDIKEPIQKIKMDLLDLTRVLGIFLDNAIEAAEETEEKTIYMGFAKKGNSVLLVLQNSCVGPIEINKIDQLGVSSKGEQRGVGLYQVQRILGKYENIIHTTEFKNNTFLQRLEIINI